MKKKRRTKKGFLDRTKMIYLVAEGTGETITKIARAALAQFQHGKFEVRHFFQVRSEEQIRQVMKQAVKDKALVAFSMVEAKLSEFLLSETNRLDIKAIDVIGDFIVQLSMFLGIKPTEIPGGQHILDEEYYRRIEAINFAVKHDDGKLPEGLAMADFVLVGLSRTGKTPLSTYLAHQGWKVANIPLHPDMETPDELFSLDARRVFALTIDVENLVRVREARLVHLGLSADAKYADPVKITDEIEWCDGFLQKQHGWRIIDISNKAIEEVATSIINLHKA